MRKNQIKLAYLVSRYPAISHTFILREARRLRELGIQIETASINSVDRPLDALTEEEREEARQTFYVKAAGAFGAITALLAAIVTRPAGLIRGVLWAVRLGGWDVRRVALCFCYLAEAMLIGRWMKRKRISHLHVHFATPAAMVGLLTAKVFGVSFSFTMHGPDELHDVTEQRLAEKIAGASFVTCIGNYARSQLMRLTPVSQWRKFEVAPLGVFPEVFQPVRRATRQGAFEVLCVGRLVPAKGQHVLLEAIAKLAQQGRDVRLRLVGDGPDAESLMALAEQLDLRGRISFEGAVNQDRIRELYAQADAFALASFAEGIPVVLMEAMAMEIPCVTTHITGIPELIRDGQDGLLVTPSDADELASALALLMDDESLREELARAGRRRVLEGYDLNRNIPRLAQIFAARLGNIAGTKAAESQTSKLPLARASMKTGQAKA